MVQSVAIIGAGYAGLACAVELARRGVRVAVFERSHTLGGRARVVVKDGRRLDNGQHILIGAYTELTRMLRLTGVSPKVLEHLPLTVHAPGQMHLQTAPLPAPLHFLVGLLRARGLDWADRKGMVRLIAHLKRCDFRLDPALTVDELLRETAQTPRVAELVWVPLCVAALNTPANTASAQVFATVLRDSVAAHAGASELLIPRVDLSELFPVQAARYLALRRGRLHTGTAIDSVARDANGFYLDGDPGRNQRYDQVVIATAPYHAAALLRPTGACDRLAQQIDALEHEPITTVYLALGEREQLPHTMIALQDGPAQWGFDRGRLGGERGLVALVISTRGPHESLSRTELELAVHQQLERQLDRRLPAPQWTMTITEKRATIACTPRTVRPGIRTPVEGLWLAGDYIDSSYPATLESAVRSGAQVADAIMLLARARPLGTHR